MHVEFQIVALKRNAPNFIMVTNDKNIALKIVNTQNNNIKQ